MALGNNKVGMCGSRHVASVWIWCNNMDLDFLIRMQEVSPSKADVNLPASPISVKLKDTRMEIALLITMMQIPSSHTHRSRLIQIIKNMVPIRKVKQIPNETWCLCRIEVWINVICSIMLIWRSCIRQWIVPCISSAQGDIPKWTRDRHGRGPWFSASIQFSGTVAVIIEVIVPCVTSKIPAPRLRMGTVEFIMGNAQRRHTQ